ncbi:MAG: hypothetical protein JNL79_28605, partial [Myxococcales bacterium]|nr:hypothetical protein [Myxococcales bacterium]
MSGSGAFDATKLVDAIQKIRGAVLGCVYDLPTADGGGTVDKGKVNVKLESGGSSTDLKKRSDPKDD